MHAITSPAAHGATQSKPDDDLLKSESARPVVLVLESNPAWRRFVIAALADAYQTTTVSDAAAVLSAALDLRPDLILIAVRPLQRRGEELIRTLRVHGDLDGAPIIVFTERGGAALRSRLLQAGAQDALPKPFAADELRFRVGAQLAGQQARQLLRAELASNSQDLVELARELVTRQRQQRAALEAVRISEWRLAAQHAVTRILAEAVTLDAAARGILQAICDCLGWKLGALWIRDWDANVLRCLDIWQAPNTHCDEFAANSRLHTFPAGIGLPGRVWASRAPAWIADVTQDDNFPRGAIAAQEKLHSAFGTPILRGEQVLGVIEFFSGEIREPDPDLLEMVGTIGSQIGQFIERTRTAEALRMSEERLRFALHAAHMGTWDWNILTDHITWSPTLESMHGLTPGAFPGTGEAAFSAVHPDDRELVRASVQRSVELGEDHDLEYRVVWPDGTIHWLEGRGSIVHDYRHQPVRMTGVCSEITERKRMEEERIQALAREQWLRVQAESANRAKDEFLAILSHELRTPLSAILAWTGALRTGKLDVQTATRALETIERSAKLQAQLIDDLLDISRITAGKLHLDMRIIHLEPCIAAAIDAVRPATEAKGVSIDVRLAPEVGAVLGDANRLQQVFWNLLSNAVRFTPHGGRIEVRLAAVAERAQIRVTDTGTGIAPDFLPYLFDRFRQAEASSTRRHGGVGLGLAIVRHLVELHGGTVCGDSSGIGHGATFTIELPLHQSDCTIAA